MRLFFFALIFVNSVYALDINIKWNQDFTKTTTIDCMEDPLCEEYLSPVATVDEEVCEECFSTSMNMTFIFNGIGESITASAKSVDMADFYNFLTTHNFISMNYETPYDLVTSMSPIRKKILYRNICPEVSGDPILFFERSVGNTMGQPRYIFCGESVHELEMFVIDLDDLFQEEFSDSQVF